jgi:NADPH-dependent 2,4-dienoyl-CoA reductase/sulfur reductase-like enzyme
VVAAVRGHTVTLVEAAPELGGQIRCITRVERRREFAHVVDWRAEQLEQLGVDVRLDTPATADLVRSFAGAAPGGDAAVVLATGSIPAPDGWYAARPDLDAIPGSDLPHVFGVRDALEGAIDDRRHVVVVDGRGYYQSSDVVEYLAARGQRVSAVSSTGPFAEGLERNDRPSFVAAARRGGVEFHGWCVVDAVEDHAVRLTDTLTGSELTLDGVDAVVLSLGDRVDDTLQRALAGTGLDVHSIGDCVAPRGVEHALFEGHRLARAL